MELIKYLAENFYTKDELLSVSKVDVAQFEEYQTLGVMPQPSYKINMQINCESFFGLHEESQVLEFYAKGYVSWLGLLGSLPEEGQNKEEVYRIFYKRYRAELERLQNLGYMCDETKWFNDQEEERDTHIEEAWQHFIQGIYGLCTRSGLPEDIAAKAVAIVDINRLSASDELTAVALKSLEKAVNLLDEASALLAPHERLKSSRHRLVNEIRRQFKLAASVVA